MRITKKRKNGFYELKIGQEIFGVENGIRLVQIVGQLEDIEEELGIDLITLLKAMILNENIYFKSEVYGEIYATENECSLNREGDLYYLHIDHIGCFYLNDYGKTWALTKEELEK